MVWRDHVFDFGSKLAMRVTKFWEKNWRGVSRDSFFLKILSPWEPILGAKIEKMILPDYVLCYIPRAMAILSWEWKFWNLLVRRRRPLWCQRRPLCGFGNFEKKFNILDFQTFLGTIREFDDRTLIFRWYSDQGAQKSVLIAMYVGFLHDCSQCRIVDGLSWRLNFIC